MHHQPTVIKPNDLADVLARKFFGRKMITVYIGSNAAAPTASIEALTAALKAGSPKLPFLRTVHLLLRGPVPFVAEGLQDRIMAYTIFSAGEVRDAARAGRAFYLPGTLGNMDSLIGKDRPFMPDVAIFKVRHHDQTGEYSLGLSVEALHTAIDHATCVIAEVDPSMPFTQGQSIVDASSLDYLIQEGIKPIWELPAPDFDHLPPAERRIGELIADHFIRDGATLQIGIGHIPDAVIGTLRQASFRDLGIQTELYSDGLMMLQKEGIVNNRKKKQHNGYSTTALIMGSKALHEFVHMRTGIQMRPCTVTNSAEVIRKNSPFISINTAMGVDLFGNVWADYVDIDHYYSGVGGQPDFVRALNDPAFGVPIIAMNSVTHNGASKIAQLHPPGVSLTASSYDGVAIVTEYGIADLRGLTVGEKALAVASIAHPRYRDAYLKYVHDDPKFTKPIRLLSEKLPRGVTLYEGPIKIDEP
ncbi:MAG: acetyl-CoA hydrolase/transferase C-terminal domain-containing protein [Opitutaceae bacterium]|nr:acetyl-CoA hydrolase/transferase C-terminal domain-containing protein [Opitutaceae bacterium]